jgi:hypothetical protein
VEDESGTGRAVEMGESEERMSVPVPLPLTWTLYTTVHCPSCGQDWHFFPEQNGRFVRDAYCSHTKCGQFGYVYTIELSLDGVQVKSVKGANIR